MTVLVTLAALTAAAAAAALWWRERSRRQQLLDQLHFERRRADSAAAEAGAAGSAANAFFDIVSHELRSPLAAIIGYQELLRDGAYGQIGDGATEPVDRIGRSAQHLLHLIDGVVDLARLRAGEVTPELENVNLDEFMDAVAVDFRLQANERALRHSTVIDAGLHTIRSDPHRLARAIHLLVVAAVKNPAGERIELRAARDTSHVTIQIRGMRMPLHDEVRDPALRTGIRLAVARATAELLGGELTTNGPDNHTAAEVVLRLPAQRSFPP